MKSWIYRISVVFIVATFFTSVSIGFALPQSGNAGASGSGNINNNSSTGGNAGASGGGETDVSSNPLQEGLSNFGGFNSGLRTEGGLIGYIAVIIRWGLGLLGTVFFIIILVNGGKYMTAGGDSKKTQDALSAIGNAVIGLVIIMGAFLITNYVTSALVGSSDSSILPEVNPIIYG